MIAFLFAGQGSQYPSMGLDLYNNYSDVKEIIDNIPSDIKNIILTGSEEINNTKYAQPIIFLVSYLIAKKLEEKGIKADYVAGLSLGEYAALAYSNVFDIKSGLEITSKRGQIMNSALENSNSGMYAILGSDIETIKNGMKDVEGIVEVANFNCPGQIVITGQLDALEKTVANLKELGVRKCIKLNVSGAFHSSLLNEASNELREVLNTYNFNKPNLNVVFNTLGTTSDLDIKDILQNQIKSSVLFEQSIEYMISQGVTTFIEVGSKNNLSTFVKKVNKDVLVLNAFDYETIMKVGEELCK